jgi:hypothetical protein
MVFALEEAPVPWKIYKPEEIVAKLRQVDVLTSRGQGVADAIRSNGTFDAWAINPLLSPSHIIYVVISEFR